MPPGWSPSSATAFLELARTWTHYVQLHSGDPGPAGTANVMAEPRQLCTFAEPAGTAPPSMPSNVALEFTDWASGGTPPRFFTSWSASTDGTFQGSGVVNVATAPSPGATLTLEAGDVVFVQTVAT